MTVDAKQMPDSAYQGATIKASKVTFSFKDPNAPEAQVLAKMYGGGFDLRLAVVNGLGLMTLGADADAGIKKLIDQTKTGSKEVAAEMKAAVALVPDAKAVDTVFTLNYLRMLGGVLPALMPMPMPKVNFQTKSNILFAAGVDKGRATLQMALPKEHLTEIIQAISQMMMQQQQQAQPQQAQPQQGQPQPQTGGPKPQGL
jgi:hypothetical protein